MEIRRPTQKVRTTRSEFVQISSDPSIQRARPDPHRELWPFIRIAEPHRPSEHRRALADVFRGDRQLELEGAQKCEHRYFDPAKGVSARVVETEDRTATDWFKENR